MFKYFLLLVSAFLLFGCQTIAEIPADNSNSYLTQEVFDTQQQQTISVAQMLEKLKQTDYVLIGEEHDLYQHHQIEAWLAQQLLAQTKHGSIVLEMAATDKQAKLAKVKQWLQTKPIARTERIAELIDWDRKWEFEKYAPLIDTVMRLPQPVLGGNLTELQLQQSCIAPIQLAGKLSTTTQVKKYIRQAVTNFHEVDDQIAHCRVLIQQLKDRSIAETILKAPKPNILFAGNFHVNKLVGVPLHLQDLAAKVNYKVVMLTSKSTHLGENQTDFIWFTKR